MSTRVGNKVETPDRTHSEAGKVKCSTCGVESHLKSAFESYSDGGHCCPACFRQAEGAGNRRGLRALGIYAVLGVLLVLIFGRWNGVNIVLFSVFWCVGVVLHELGHALAARLVGLRVTEISLGSGRVVFEGYVRGVRILVSPYPNHGHCAAFPDPRKRVSLRRFRLQNAVHCLGGPIVDFVLLLVVVVWVGPAELLASVFRMSDEPVPFLVFAATLSTGLFVTMVPRFHGAATREESANDLSMFLEALRTDEHAYELYYEWGCVSLAEHMLHQGRVTEARELLEVDDYSDSANVWRVYAEVLRRDAQLDRCRETLESLLGWEGETDDGDDALFWPSLFASVHDDLARLALEQVDLESAEHHADEALNRIPWEPAYRATRGAARVLAGELESGVAELQPDDDARPMPDRRAFCLYFLARAQAMQGDEARAERDLRAARRLDPRCGEPGREAVGEIATTWRTTAPHRSCAT